MIYLFIFPRGRTYFFNKYMSSVLLNLNSPFSFQGVVVVIVIEVFYSIDLLSKKHSLFISFTSQAIHAGLPLLIRTLRSG